MALNLDKSAAAFAEAKQNMPGGVNSPVRSYRGVGGTPPFIARAAGSRIVDIDGNEYIDYVLSWGPMILGHAHPEVVAAIIAVKGLGRFSELDSAAARERFIIGTLSSMIWAVACAVLVVVTGA